MKRSIFSTVLILFIAFLFPACEGPMGPQGPSGDDGFANWEVFDLTVDSKHWQWDGVRELYFYDFQDSRIDNLVAHDGAILVSIWDNDLKRYFPLEYTAHYYDTIYYTETINFEYWAGGIGFNIACSDLFDNTDYEYQPRTYTFKVTLMW